MPEKEACHITEAVMHVASGGENYVQAAKVPEIESAINMAKAKGIYIIGAVVEDSAQDINKLKLKFPLGLVLGAETVGIRPKIQNILDEKVYIPMHGAKLSLNVNTACAIFCQMIDKQRTGNSHTSQDT